MAQPKAYKRDVSFAELKGSQSDLGAKLDTELDQLSKSMDQILKNLAMLQEDDGRLKPGVVHGDSLASETAIGVKPATNWQTGVKYGVNDTVYRGYAVFRARLPHKAAPSFEDDMMQGKWETLLNLAPIIRVVEEAAANEAVQAVSKHLGPIQLIAAEYERINAVAQKLELIQDFSAQLGRIERVYESLKFIDQVAAVAPQMQELVKMASEISDVAAAAPEIREFAASLGQIRVVAEISPAVEQVAGASAKISDVAENLDAILAAPEYAVRAETAATRAVRKDGYDKAE